MTGTKPAPAFARMPAFRTSCSLAFAASLVACVALGAGCSSADDEPADLSDPGYLPTGTYGLVIAGASCNVNPQFQSGSQVALFRNGASTPAAVNIPLPTKLGGEGASVFGTGRQDIDLTKRHVDGRLVREEGCPNIAMVIDVTELTATRLSILYREIPDSACGVPECSVDFTFDLVEAACPRECNATGAALHADANGSMVWSCDCD